MKKGITSTVLKNFSQLLLSMLVTTIGTFLCYTILVRRMSVDDYADFSSVLALITMTAVFVSNIAAGIVANREIAVKPHASYKILVRFVFFRSIACLISIVYLYYIIRRDYHENMVLFCATIMLLLQDVFYELFEQVAFGLKITKISMGLNIISVLCWLFVVLAIPAQGASLAVELLCYSVICVGKTICYGIWVFKTTKKYASIEYDLQTKKLIIFSLPYLYNRILGTMTTQLPVLLLKGYSEVSETAYYSIGEKYTTPIIRVTTAAISAVFPFITKELKENRLRAARYISDIILCVVSFGACFAVLLCSTSGYWIVGLLGEKYSGATEALNYQIWFAIILSADCIFSMILSCDYKQKLLAIVTSIDVAISLIFLWKGLEMGAKGVALAKLFAALICLIYHLGIIAFIYGNKNIMLRLFVSWSLFVILLLSTLFQDSIFIKAISPIAALIISYIINRKTIKHIILYSRNYVGKR